MSIPQAPQGNVPAIGIPNSQDYPRLVATLPYFEGIPLAELIEPSVQEATEALLPSLVPPYVQSAAEAAVSTMAVLLTGSTMSGPLFLSPMMPTQPSQAASMAYVDSMVATAGIPEVPPTPVGQLWGRETGQWVPINLESGVFLPLAGGVMAGQINMSGNSIINLAATPQMPYGAAPAQWVLQQIAANSLYQGTWNADTNTPDLTLSGYWQNGFTWIVTTQSPTGVEVSQTIPGLTGVTVFNGDTIVYSTVDGAFTNIHSAGLTLAEANALFVPLVGGQMSGALLLNSNATQPLQATPLQQVQSLIAASVFPEPPSDGQTYGRNGLQQAWMPVLPTAGGVLTGSLTLSGNVAGALMAVPLQQVQSLIAGGTASYLPLTGGILTGPLTTTSTVAVGSSSSSTPAPLTVGGQGISYLTLGTPGANIAFGVTSGQLYCYQNGAAIAGPFAVASQLANYLPLTGGSLSGALNVNAALNVAGATTLNGVVSVPSSSINFGNSGTAGNSFYIGNLSGGLLGINWAPDVYEYLGSGPTWLWAGPSATVMSLDANAGVLNVLGNVIAPSFQVGGSSTFSLYYSGPNPTLNWGPNSYLQYVPASTVMNVVLGTVQVAQFQANGSLALNNQCSAGTFAINGGNSYALYIQDGTGYPVLNWVPNYWNTCVGSTGQRQWNGSSGMLMQLTWDGDLFVIGEVCDARAKQETSVATEGLGIVRQLVPKHFTRHFVQCEHSQGHVPRDEIGLIAQEVQAVLPTAVSDSGLNFADDEPGTPTLLTIEQAPLIAVLVNAVKQILNRIEALEAAASITPPAADTA